MTEIEINKIINRLATKYCTSNPFELCDCLGICIEKEYLGTLNGYYNKTSRIKQIRINSALDYFEQKIACAHELGHAILHPSINSLFLSAHTYIVTNKYENEANIFANMLILKDEGIAFKEQ